MWFPGNLQLDWVLLLRGIDCALHMTLGGFIGVETCAALVAELLVLDL